MKKKYPNHLRQKITERTRDIIVHLQEDFGAKREDIMEIMAEFFWFYYQKQNEKRSK